MKTDEEIIKDEELETLEGGISSVMEQAAASSQGTNRCCNGNLQHAEESVDLN